MSYNLLQNTIIQIPSLRRKQGFVMLFYLNICLKENQKKPQLWLLMHCRRSACHQKLKCSIWVALVLETTFCSLPSSFFNASWKWDPYFISKHGQLSILIMFLVWYNLPHFCLPDVSSCHFQRESFSESWFINCFFFFFLGFWPEANIIARIQN